MTFEERANRVLENMKVSNNPGLNKIANLDEIFMVVDSCEFDPAIFKVDEDKYCCFSVNNSDAKYQAITEILKYKPGYNQSDFDCIRLNPLQMAGFLVAINGGIAFSDRDTFNLVHKEEIEKLK